MAQRNITKKQSNFTLKLNYGRAALFGKNVDVL